jgi:uncharacterized membrane protein HdeD (DUF308 family)
MMTSTRDAYRRRQSRRSTWAGLAGVLLIAIGIILTVTNVGGYLFPTILAFIGVGSLLAGVATGATLIAENFRVRRDQSYYDDE